MSLRRPSRYRAFTLVELLATIVVLGVIATATSSILLAATDGYLSATVRAEAHTEVSVGLDRIVRELRSIPFDGDAGGVAPDIDTVTTSSIAWDDDSSLALDGTDLEITIDGGSAAVLVADVSAFTVTCYDESNAALGSSLAGAACDAIRRVEISITCTRRGISETLHTRVFLRSTMSGAAA